MTGALVAVGQGRLSVPQLKEVLEARDSLAYPQGIIAPAHGLFLTRVDYKETGMAELTAYIYTCLSRKNTGPGNSDSEPAHTITKDLSLVDSSYY